MKPLGDRNDHYWLVQRMARATDTDLRAAYASGELTQAQWAGMVERCRHCAWSEGCARWLDKDSHADVPPPTCLNRKRFSSLKEDAAS